MKPEPHDKVNDTVSYGTPQLIDVGPLNVGHNNLFCRELIINNYIRFDSDSKKTITCVGQKDERDMYMTLRTDIDQLKSFSEKQRKPRQKLHLTLEISGEAGYRYDALVGLVDTITVSNPIRVTWVYRTAKKTDRIDDRKQVVLLSIGEVRKVHIKAKRFGSEGYLSNPNLPDKTCKSDIVFQLIISGTHS